MKEKHSSTPSNYSKSTVGNRENGKELFLAAGRRPVWHPVLAVLPVLPDFRNLCPVPVPPLRVGDQLVAAAG